MTTRTLPWRQLPVSLTELCLKTTLRCGQSFRWQHDPSTDEWTCSLFDRIVVLRQDDVHLHCRAALADRRCASSSPGPVPSDAELADQTLALVTGYLNLTPNLTNLYRQWARADANFRKKAPRFAGVRILRQDPWETLCGFICSSNNNIIRIGQMMEKLCVHYGKALGTHAGRQYWSFPRAASLAKPGTEARLRELGFGYRAKYLYRTAVLVDSERPSGWLHGLLNPDCASAISSAGTLATPGPGRSEDSSGDPDAKLPLARQHHSGDLMTPVPPGGRQGYRDAHESLQELPGVGPKVADCICLFGLGWGEAVPVDTHVWQIAVRDYRFGRKSGPGPASLTRATYDAVGNRFRELWGDEAGWAHSVLFTADLRAFSDRGKAAAKKKVKKEEEEGETDDLGSVRDVAVVDVKSELKMEDEDENEEQVLDATAPEEVVHAAVRAKRRRSEAIKEEPGGVAAPARPKRKKRKTA